MSMNNTTTMRLHIYAQDCWHFPACILGTQESLIRLRHLIEKAIAMQSSDEFVVSDGEGYSLTVICSDSDEFWNQVCLPYTDAVAQYDNAAVHPLLLVDNHYAS